jgi:hypothetical protein
VFLWNARNIGHVLDSYKGVPVYDNGLLFFRSYGKNYAPDGYYFGQKWQCVEFVKRFYFEAKHHKLPDVLNFTFNISEAEELDKLKFILAEKIREGLKVVELDGNEVLKKF